MSPERKNNRTTDTTVERKNNRTTNTTVEMNKYKNTIRWMSSGGRHLRLYDKIEKESKPHLYPSNH